MENRLLIEKKRVSPLALILKAILVFFYIYEFSMDGWGLPTFVTSRRVVILIIALVLLCGAFFHGGKIRMCFPNGIATKKLKNFFFFNVFLLIYTASLFFVIGGSGELASEGILRLLLFGIFPVVLFYLFFNNLDELVNAVLLATIFQSIVICICLASPSFTELIDRIFTSPSTNEYVINHRSEYAGGIACITAPGLLKFSMGIIACLYKILQTTKSKYVFLYFYLSLIGTMVARTGLFVSLTGLCIILFFGFRRKKLAPFLKIMIMIIAVVIVGLCIIDYFNLWEFLAYRLRRFSKLSDGIAQGFMVGYFQGPNNSYPPLSMKTIIGTGIVSGWSNNGVHINADGGFYRLYAAFGLPLCIVFYVTFFISIIKIALSFTKNEIKYTLLFFVAVFAIGEFKEYTIYMQYMVCIFYSMAWLANKPSSLRGAIVRNEQLG